MIEIRFEERVKIGLQYVLESLHGCSPFGQEKIRRLRFYTPEERAELETELYNVERGPAAGGGLKGQDTKLMRSTLSPISRASPSTTPSPRWPFWTRTAPAAGASTSPTAPPPSSRRSVRPRRTWRSVFSRRRRTRRRTTCA